MKVNNCCYSDCKDAHQYCYSHQVHRTARLVVEKLQLNEKILNMFQSRLGNDPWLSPATDATMSDWRKRVSRIWPLFVLRLYRTNGNA